MPREEVALEALKVLFVEIVSFSKLGGSGE
jgi:hypothetical protein